jgi:hypothetical protein
MASAFRAASSEADLLACNTTVQCVVSNGAPPSCSVPGVGFVRPRSLTRSERVVERNRAVVKCLPGKTGERYMSAFTVTPPARTKESNKLEALVKTAADIEPSVFHDSVSAAVRGLRLRLEENYRKTYPDRADIIHLVLDQEEARAWRLSPFPHLLLPDLVQARIEKLNLRSPLDEDCYRAIPTCGFASA